MAARTAAVRTAYFLRVGIVIELLDQVFVG